MQEDDEQSILLTEYDDLGNQEIKESIVSTKLLEERIKKLEEDIKDPKTIADFIVKFRVIFVTLITVILFLCGCILYWFNKNLDQTKTYIELQLSENNKQVNQRLDYIEKQQDILIENKFNKADKVLKNNIISK
jgi:hypothetical protein